MKKDVIEDFVGGKGVVQAGFSKRRVTKEFNSREWLTLGNIRCNIFFLQKRGVFTNLILV